MAENYVVNYSINVNAAQATTAITDFQNAVTRLQSVSQTFTNVQTSMNNFAKSTNSFARHIKKIDTALEDFNKKKHKLQIGGIAQTKTDLDAIIKRLERIDKIASRNLGRRWRNTSGGTKNTSQNSTGGRQTTYNGPVTKKGAPIVRNQENIGYKTLGPTPLPSNGGIAIDMLKGMGIAYGVSGIGQAISSIVEQATGYDNLMKTVENILKTHDTKDNFSGRFQSMGRLVRNVGMETKFTVTQVADAAKFLAMAGLDVEAIQSSIRPIADIALIGDTDLGETADLVTNVMTAYNIAPKKMRQAADVMTNTFTMSNTTLSEIAESYKYAASILSAGGVGFEEATAAIGVLGDAGIKGSQAGTTLRTIMANVVNPTKKQAAAWKAVGVSTKDKSGQMKPLLEIFQELNEKNLNVADYYRLFHKTAASGAIALVDHVDKWNDVYLENFLSGGISAKLADEKKNTLQGKWAQVESTFIDTGVTAFQGVQGHLQMWMDKAIGWLQSDEAVQMFRDVANTMIEFIELLKKSTKYFKNLYDMFAPLVKIWIKFQLVIWPVVRGMQAFKSVWLGLKGFGAIGASISGVTRGMLGLAEASTQAATAGSMVAASTKANTNAGGYFSKANILRQQVLHPNWRRDQIRTQLAISSARLNKLNNWYPSLGVLQAAGWNIKSTWGTIDVARDRELHRNRVLAGRLAAMPDAKTLSQKIKNYTKDLWAYTRYNTFGKAERAAGPQAYLIPWKSLQARERWIERKHKWTKLAQQTKLKAQEWDWLSKHASSNFDEVRYAQQQRDAYLNANRRAEENAAKLKSKNGFWKSWKGDWKDHWRSNIKPNVMAATSNIAGMGVGALGSYMMMNQMTKDDANGWDYASGGLYGLAGMAAMSGVGLPVAAGLAAAGAVAQIGGAIQRWGELEDSVKNFAAANQMINGTLVNSSTRTEKVLETVWRKNLDINTLLERRIELSKQLYGIESADATTTKDVGTSVYNDFFNKFDAADSLVNSTPVAGKAAMLLNSFGAEYGVSISERPWGWILKLPNGQEIPYNNPDGASDANDAVMYDVAAAMEMLHGQYRSKILDENQKRLSQLLYGKATEADVRTWQKTFDKSHNPIYNKSLITPDQWNVSKEEAANWNGEDVAKSYLGAYMLWESLKQAREAQDIIAEFKGKLNSKTYSEADVVKALKYGDYNIMGPLLRDYDPNNIAAWYTNQGYYDGAWHTVNGESPEIMAQMAAGNMQKLLDSIHQLGLASDPATEGIRAYANALLTLAESFLGEANKIEGKTNGETKTVNGQKWRWNSMSKVWELVDDDNQFFEVANGITAFTGSIRNLKEELGKRWYDVPFTEWVGGWYNVPFTKWGSENAVGFQPTGTSYVSDPYTGPSSQGVQGLTPAPWSPNAKQSKTSLYPDVLPKVPGAQPRGQKSTLTMTAQQMGNAIASGGSNPNKRGLGSGGDDEGKKRNGGPKASDYKSHYNKGNAAPKQVIVRIENLMNVDKVDLSNPDKAAVVSNLKAELAQALVDVVHDFDETWHG